MLFIFNYINIFYFFFFIIVKEWKRKRARAGKQRNFASVNGFLEFLIRK